ncbi:hypothetical protein [Bacillus kwashiorkori]|uniref:hypothetical protein n=1 Tax=Bacillus kwashiorkori TaxID=1522318 RepID=UPI00078175A3|nr:hypothetical protein [Bacillus kwashiorkori]
MKRYVVIGFGSGKHIVTGKVFEGKEEADEYLIYLCSKMFGKIIGIENTKLEDVDIFEMDYVPFKNNR